MALQTFTASQVLTAAQMNTLQANDYNQTVSTKTANYVLVAADKGTTIVMNSATATTITVNTALFTAGDTLRIQNIGAGACVVTAGTATVTTSGTLSIPQWGGGTLSFTSASASIYSSNAIQPGLNLITSQTIGSAVATIDISNCFSADYDQYLVSWRTTPSTTLKLKAQFLTSVPAAITTGYYYAGWYSQYTSATLNGANQNNGSSYEVGSISASSQGSGQFTLLNPFVTDISYMTTQFVDAGNPYQYSGYNSSILALPSLRLTTSTGTITGGYVKVYGYKL